MRLILLWTSLLSVCCQDLVFVGDVDEEDSKVEEATVVEEPSSREIFVATNDWQEIKPGQAIPQGLHVRMDMQTGKKEARLMQVCYFTALVRWSSVLSQSCSELILAILKH